MSEPRKIPSGGPYDTSVGNGRNTSRSFERHDRRHDEMPFSEVAKHTRKGALPLPTPIDDDEE